VLGLAMALGKDDAAGEVQLVALRDQLRDLGPGANEHARAAANCLKELCTRLESRDRLAEFLQASLARWRKAADGTAWWPADLDDAPAAARDAALAALQSLPEDQRRPLDRMALGAVLLRLDRYEAARRELEAAAAGSSDLPPELLADLVRVRMRQGDSKAAESAASQLEALANATSSATPRIRAALLRAERDLDR